jgi:CheY-like chemotaxis protein
MKNVLIVEDDVDAREGLAAVLEGEGYSVLEAGDGEEALERLRHFPVCLVLLDLMMPGMNGWTFRAEQMKDPQLADIPVVIVTADATASAKAQRLGVASYVTKPIDFTRLLQVVSQHC